MQEALTYKGQATRVADVFLYGPLMIIGGAALTTCRPVGARPLLGIGLVALGIGTMVYNAVNWYRAAQLPADRPTGPMRALWREGLRAPAGRGTWV